MPPVFLMMSTILYVLCFTKKRHVIVRPLSTVEYPSTASVFHGWQWSD